GAPEYSPGHRPGERGGPPREQALKGRQKTRGGLLPPFQGLWSGAHLGSWGVAPGWILTPLRGWKTSAPGRNSREQHYFAGIPCIGLRLLFFFLRVSSCPSWIDPPPRNLRTGRTFARSCARTASPATAPRTSKRWTSPAAWPSTPTRLSRRVARKRSCTSARAARVRW